jgi:hypothetical protein
MTETAQQAFDLIALLGMSGFFMGLVAAVAGR